MLNSKGALYEHMLANPSAHLEASFHTGNKISWTIGGAGVKGWINVNANAGKALAKTALIKLVHKDWRGARYALATPPGDG